MPISKLMRRLPLARLKQTAPQPSATQRRRADAPGAAAPPSATNHAGGNRQSLPASLQAGLEQLGGIALDHA
ncbi:hypothetical protein, partial [Burkholderia gladioli]|uniref:hypothetical protein n=1 Tax=Burkholderia gladioli TaxID=28095 RepID=UPI001ABAC573